VSFPPGRPHLELKAFFEKAKKYAPGIMLTISPSVASATGTDEGRIATTPDILPPSYVLKLGQFCFEVPPEEDVKPNFRTPPMVFHVYRGAAAKDI
jgi:hypothetical protein